MTTTTIDNKSVTKGDRVGVKFRAFDVRSNELLVDTQDEEVTFVVGIGSIIPGLDANVLGKKVGEKFKEDFPPDQAFGIRDDSRTVKCAKNPQQKEGYEVGASVRLSNDAYGRIAEVKDDHVVVDLNHPFADRTVRFEVEITSIENDPRNVQSGIRVETLQPGDGKTFPKPGQTVTVHYVGTLTKDGKEFDSSRRRAQPFRFQIGVGLVIPGWEIGIQRLSLNERALLFVSSEMAYGSEGAGGVIPPNTDLTFDVELLKIE